MMCGKSDLLSSLWIPFTVFLCSSILMTSIYIPNRMVKENVSGDVHNHIKYIGRYDNFDSMIHRFDSYPVKNNKYMAEKVDALDLKSSTKSV